MDDRNYNVTLYTSKDSYLIGVAGDLYNSIIMLYYINFNCALLIYNNVMYYDIILYETVDIIMKSFL